MNDKRFFDTNILFYAYDTSDPGKQSTAEGLIRQAAADASGVVSTQVLGEFFHATVTRKAVLDAQEAAQAIRALAGLQVVEIDLPLVHAAIAYHRQYQLRYWDALILAAAKRAACVELLTEDFNDGSTMMACGRAIHFAPPPSRKGDRGRRCRTVWPRCQTPSHASTTPPRRGSWLDLCESTSRTDFIT